MNWKNYTLVFIFSLLLFGLYAFKVDSPGYMDAEYYYGMGLRIARDQSFTEPFLWNYLHQTQDLPRPGFTYWMPLPALISAASMIITGVIKFKGAQIGIVLIAALVPMISMNLTYGLTGNKIYAWLGAGFSAFPVYYSPLMVTTDSFGIIMVLGGLFIINIRNKQKLANYLLLGLISGLIHLSRADGILWLAVGLAFVLLFGENRLARSGLLIGGYLIVMVPWFTRNWLAFGELMPAGNQKMLWLTEYNELFTFQTNRLNFSHWFGQGVTNIGKSIFRAFTSNLKTALFVSGQVIIAPFVILGIWRNKEKSHVLVGIVIYGLIFLVMTVLFPFAGMRGGFLHSGAAIQPLIWALAGSGFAVAINFGVKKRNWKLKRASLLFGVSLVVIFAIATGIMYWERVIGDDFRDPYWNQSYQAAVKIGQKLQKIGATEDDLVIINNPPGFYIATGMSSVVIPSGGLEELVQASQSFNAKYLVLEANHPETLKDLYVNPESESRLSYIGTEKGVHYFSFK